MPVQELKVLVKVTEVRDGCVYKTAELGEYWIPMHTDKKEEVRIATSLGGDYFASLPTKRMEELKFRIFRRVPDVMYDGPQRKINGDSLP